MNFGFPFLPFGFPFTPFGFPFGPFGFPFGSFGAGGLGFIPSTTVATTPFPV